MLIMSLILLVVWAMSQEKCAKIWTVMGATRLKKGKCEKCFLFLFSPIFSIFLELPSIYIFMRKFNTFSCWMTARVKKKIVVFNL